MALTKAFKDGVANQLFSGTILTLFSNYWLSLHTGDPGIDGNLNEVLPGANAYLRQAQGTWSTSSGGAGAVTSTTDALWTNMPPVTVTHVAVHDLQSGGNAMCYGALSQAKQVEAGGEFDLKTGDVDFTIT